MVAQMVQNLIFKFREIFIFTGFFSFSDTFIFRGIFIFRDLFIFSRVFIFRKNFYIQRHFYIQCNFYIQRLLMFKASCEVKASSQHLDMSTLKTQLGHIMTAKFITFQNVHPAIRSILIFIKGIRTRFFKKIFLILYSINRINFIVYLLLLLLVLPRLLFT